MSASPPYAHGLRARHILLALAILGFGALLLLKAREISSYAPPVTDVAAEAMHRRAPEFKWVDRDRNTFELADLYRDAPGKPLLINFWATWCPPCIEEMDSLAFLARRFGDRIQFVAVTIDESWDPVDRFLASKFQGAPPFRVLRDPEGASAEAFGTSMFPETYLIDPAGFIDTKFTGPRDWSTAEMIQFFERKLSPGAP